ncbi:MAG: hypothetical protein HY248_02590, partial [Fimbriimonas ginsengisoli]|nr:hypothetical protein [Fimbriimonas ginsengisoli]
MPILSRALIFFIIVGGLGQAATIVLKRAWIEKFKNRATIEDVTFTVDHAHPRPNQPAADGDMHVAGRAPKEIGLPMVAEIMNADNNEPAVKLVHANEGTENPITVTGAWRLWFEHPPTSGSQIQFDTVPPAGNTNPDHCFEIHPLTKVGDNDVTDSLHDIAGFTPKDVTAAFSAYEKLSISVQASQTAVTLTSNKSGFNYVLFTMRTTSKTAKLDDGGIAVFADVIPEGGDEADAVAKQVRMIFVSGSEPWKQAQSLQIGDELTLLGTPRLNLNAIFGLLTPGKASGVVQKKLPYEMIVVALEGSSAEALAA